MLDEKIIKQATEEVLEDLGAGERRFEIEPAMGAPKSETRQIRVFDEDGTDRATVVDFQDKNGNVSIYFEDIKETIRKQLELLIKTSEKV
jgi:cell fate (sporulation/competence/biofilm development) regulator YlbF (YheA/YmcA/DUF963 family)